MKRPYIVITNETSNDGDICKQLGVAIVRRAIDDYIQADKVLKNTKSSNASKTHATRMIADVERFLDSEWYKELVDISPDIIRKHLKEKCKKHEKSK